MKKIAALIFTVMFCMFSCNDDTEARQAETARDLKKKEAVFAAIDRSWHFNTQPVNPAAQSLAANWEQWRIFLGELAQKPQSTIGAFRKKSDVLSLKVKDLGATIPGQFNKPEIRSRIAVLATKINSLNLYMSLDQIPDKKVMALISDINTELSAVQLQMGEIVRKSQIPREEGESDMIRMLDTARAIPSKPQIKPLKVE